MDRLAIKQIGGSLYFRLPAYFVRKHGIEAGDLFDLLVNADGSIIKLVKSDEQPVRQKTTETVQTVQTEFAQKVTEAAE
jgi:hypothetical protein